MNEDTPISEGLWVVVCCSMLQHIMTVCCSSTLCPYIVLQCVKTPASEAPCVAVCCSMLQRVVTVWCSVLQPVCCSVLKHLQNTCIQRTLCCCVLQCVAVCCSVLLCVAVCCIVLHFVAVLRLNPITFRKKSSSSNPNPLPRKNYMRSSKYAEIARLAFLKYPTTPNSRANRVGTSQSTQIWKKSCWNEEIHMDRGWKRVARGGYGAKAPPLATRLVSGELLSCDLDIFWLYCFLLLLMNLNFW